MFLKALMQKHRKYRVFSKNIVNTVLLSTTAWKNIGIYGVSCFRGWRNDVNSVFFWGLGAKKVESSDISDNLHPLRVYFVFGILSNYLEGSPTQVVETERNHVVLKWKLQNLYVKTWPPVFFKKSWGQVYRSQCGCEPSRLRRTAKPVNNFCVRTPVKTPVRTPV